jgi:hypothetical protein
VLRAGEPALIVLVWQAVREVALLFVDLMRSRCAPLVFVVVAAYGCARTRGHDSPSARPTGSGSSVAPTASPPPVPEPLAWVIKVHNVKVSTLRTGSTDHWDGAVPDAPASRSGLCGVIGAGVGGVAGALVSGSALAVGGAALGKSVADSLCPERRSVVQRERDPQAPDLVVALTVGDQDVKRLLRTQTARDSYEESFDYAFVVPTAVVPPRGLHVRVQDQDGESDYETIGALYLTREQLVAAAGSPLLVLSDGALTRLELSVVAATETPRQVYAVDVSKGLQLVDATAVLAGEVLEIRAEGSYKLAPKWATIGPAGGKAKDYSIREEPFASAVQGAAVATIGLGARLDKLLVPTCVRVTARFSGQLVLGVNDTKPADNTGDLKFTVVRRIATAAEWLDAGTAKPCE